MLFWLFEGRLIHIERYDMQINVKLLIATNGWINGWTKLLYYTDAKNASENNDFQTDLAIFTKALQMDRPTEQRTNRRTNQWTDIPSYKDAIAASKNLEFLIGNIVLQFFFLNVFRRDARPFCIYLVSMQTQDFFY